MRYSSTQRVFISAVLFCFAFVFVTGMVFVPRQGQAQGSPIVIEQGELTRTVVQREVRLNFGQAMLASALVGIVNAVQLFAQQAAYDLAVGLSTGCRGEQACAFIDDFGTWFTKNTYDAAGEFLASLAEGPLWDTLGIDLCNPRIPDIGLAISLGLIGQIQRPTPRCDFQNTIQNWGSIVREVQDPHALLSHLSLSLGPGQSDLGQAMRAHEAFSLKIEQQKQASILDRLEGGGIKPIFGPISGNITTPSTVLKENFNQLAHQGEDNVISTGDVVGAAINDGEIWTAVGTSFLSTFANTLLSRMLQMALQGIFGQGTQYETPDLRENLATGEFALDARAGVQASATAVGLLSTQLRTSSGSYDFLTELAACPDQQYASPFNCVIDDQFMLGIQRAIAGTPITVQEAIDGKFLDPSKPFGFISLQADPPMEPERTEGYAYSAMKKLRLLRIIPVGWEFAAERILEQGTPVTLGDVLAGWNNPDSPFYGLVDPNWLLKAPVSQCGSQAWSALLDGSGTGRREVCVDIRHCVAQDELGNCSAWGYCTRERNIWLFDGDECFPQYASCETFARKDVSGTQQQKSLLENTVDFGACNAENAGCTAYTTGDSVAPHLYLDGDAQICEANAKGCTEFIDAPDLAIPTGTGASYGDGLKRAHYRIPPDYLSCTGEVTDRLECGEYAGYCRAEEVGCEQYTPIRSSASNGAGPLNDPAIPGIVTDLDKCGEECVGYDTYLKLASRFEPQFTNKGLENKLTVAEYTELWPTGTTQENLYPLIPRYALACNSLEAGCDEFTNLRTEQRQYYSDLRSCQVPGTDSRTYFTWEGSESSGYQLRTWSFKASNQNYTADNVGLGVDFNQGTAKPPCTNYAVQVENNGNIRVDCQDSADNQAVCNPGDSFDCRTFYDEQGNKFNRSFSRTIISTAECQSFRWTGLTRLPEVAARASESPDVLKRRLEQVACKAARGHWNENVNQCLYLGAPSLSQSCSSRASGCRGFKGNSGSNIQTLFTEQFESPADITSNWGPASRVSFSNESLVVNEHSLKADRIGSGSSIARSLASPNTPTPQITPGTTYFLRFNAKGTAGQELSIFVSNEDAQDVFPGRVVLNTEWQHFEIGPLVLTNINQAALQQCSFDTSANVTRACQDDGATRCTVPANGTSCTYLESPQLVFENPGGSVINFYIDDLTFYKSSDVIYLVKNSWNIPISCDKRPAAAGGGYLRGAMLGCRAYTNRAGTPEYLKSFSSLCRAKSVGCTKLIDTRNSDSPLAQNFNTENNGICRAPVGPCRIDTDSNGLPDTEVCTVQTGQTSCAYGPGLTGTEDNLTVDDWTVSSDHIRYVVTKPEVSCQPELVGCQELGYGNGQTKTLINDPDKYSETMCRFEEQGCAIWQRQNQSLAYFKDPGTAACQWQTNITVGYNQYSGWFRDVKQPVYDPGNLVNSENKCQGYGTWNYSAATKTCVNDQGATVNLPGRFANCGDCGTGTNPACSECADLCNRGAGGVWNANSNPGHCEADAPCYGVVKATGSAPNPKIAVDSLRTFLIGGATFGIYRNADAYYQSRTGACPAEQATCTEFIDPTDTTQRSDGQAYYRKDNERLEGARKDCNSQVSRKQGCVLFNKTENPAQRWNAQESYIASEQSERQGQPSLIDPRSIAGQNDVNDVLKVKRDRECAEWFNCSSSQWVWDAQAEGGGEFKAKCTMIQRCDELNPAQQTPGGLLIQCAHWNVRPSLSRMPNVSPDSCSDAGLHWDPDAKKCDISSSQCRNFGGVIRGTRCELGVLTAETYLLRDRRYQGQEYTGYSIPNIYALDQLDEINFGGFTDSSQDYRLAHISSANCTSDAQCSGHQKCAPQGKCTDGLARNVDPMQNECRGYPERDAPYPNTTLVSGNKSFNPMGRCMATTGVGVSNCLCDYTKAEFGAEKLYFAPESENVKNAYCFGINDKYSQTDRPKSCGSEDEVDANLVDLTREQCQGDGGTCQNKTAQIQAKGFWGYCLEQDPSRRATINADPEQRACLTWLPVDRLAGAADIFNQFAQAGYQPTAQGGRFYCLFANQPDEIELFDHSVTVPTGGDGTVRVITNNVENLGIYKHDIQAMNINISQQMERDGNGVPETSYHGLNEHSYGVPYSYHGLLHTNELQEEINFSSLRGPTDTSFFRAADATIGIIGNEGWWWYVVDDGGDDGGIDRYEEDVAPDISQFRDALKRTEGDLGVPLSQESKDLSCEKWIYDNDSGDIPDENYDGLGIALRFDESGKLTHLRIASCNADDYGFEGRGHVIDNVRVSITPHAQCTSIAGIDTAVGSSDSAPRTNVLWSGNVDFRIKHNVEFCRASDALRNISISGICQDSLNGQLAPPGNSTISRSQCQGQGGTCVPALDIIGDRTDYLTDSAGTRVNIAPVDYRQNTLYPPFGSSPSLNTPPLAGNHHPWFLNNNLQGDPDNAPFAGWPFGCQRPPMSEAVNIANQDNQLDCSVRLTDEQDGNLQYPIFTGATDSGISISNEQAGLSTWENAKASFRRLFARSDKLYTWNPGVSYLRGNYGDVSAFESVCAGGFCSWDDRNDTHYPTIHAVGPGNDGLEEIENMSGVTVNDQYLPGSVVLGTDGALFAGLKFFAYADKDHMPIRRIAVAWGDGHITPGEGMYQNRRGSGKCDIINFGFGGIPDQTCLEKPYRYENNYNCDQDSNNWRAETACPVAEFAELYGGCCVFRPAVQITDNWGLCSGEPSGAYGNSACSVPYKVPPAPEGAPFLGNITSYTTQAGWIPFKGVIVIAPRIGE